MQLVHLYHRLAKQSAELADEMVMAEHRKAILDIAKAWAQAAEIARKCFGVRRTGTPLALDLSHIRQHRSPYLRAFVANDPPPAFLSGRR
jgi:hypothetical protein